MGAPRERKVIPYLFVPQVDRVIDFCRDVFDATVLGRLTRPSGSVMHAEIEIAGCTVMMGEPVGEFEANPGWVFVYVDDCDAVFARALAAGARSVMDIADMHHAGQRYGGVEDPCGNVWWIADPPTEDVSWTEQQRRIDALTEQELGR